MFRFRFSTTLTLLLALTCTRLALADAATAEILFQQGKALMDDGDYAAACPKLAESFRLDPATGALLALAICHEKEGRLATAWAEYVDVAGRAKSQGREDRAAAARQSAEKLRPRLSRMVIEVGEDAEAVEGLEIRRDGEVVGKAAWGVAVPVDGGKHRVEATAPGRVTWSTSVSLNSENSLETVTVPTLSAAPAALARTAHSTDKGAKTTPVPGEATEPVTLTPLRIAGIVTAGVGLVGVSIGTYYGVSAMSGAADTDDDCPNNRCTTAEATSTRSDAKTAGSVSTLAFAIGGALVAAGATLYLIGEPTQETASTATLTLQPGISNSTLGLDLGGSF